MDKGVQSSHLPDFVITSVVDMDERLVQDPWIFAAEIAYQLYVAGAASISSGVAPEHSKAFRLLTWWLSSRPTGEEAHNPQLLDLLSQVQQTLPRQSRMVKRVRRQLRVRKMDRVVSESLYQLVARRAIRPYREQLNAWGIDVGFRIL